MYLSSEAMADRAAWIAADIEPFSYDRAAMRAATSEAPAWVHMGCGNIFRAFVASIADELLASGSMRAGIVGMDRDGDLVNEVYRAHDDLGLTITLGTDGSMHGKVVGSVAEMLWTGSSTDMAHAEEVFCAPSLQMVSYTMTEKGYVVKGSDGSLLPAISDAVAADVMDPSNLIVVTTRLLRRRWEANGAPIALVSMDNCSHNGDLLRGSVLAVAKAMVAAGHATEAFVEWLSNPECVGFPCSMIDKIVPRPDDAVARHLGDAGIEGMDPFVTPHGTYIAPFANAEAAQYLVIEDVFPNGRPALEEAGVVVCARATVEAAESMKVSCCLNPLHTSLAVFGCLLGVPRICDEMADPDLAALARGVGYAEGLPVVRDPGIINPQNFIDEVVERRLPNPFLPDTPERIATDTSQKVGVRFGATIQGHVRKGDTSDLRFIPLAIAGWLRYLRGIDDAGNELACSPDPRLAELQGLVTANRVDDILADASLFSLDLHEAGIAPRIKEYLDRMDKGPGSVRTTLHQVVSA